ncbi:unnamed protein product [Notodromas monacha]|uniref:serine C-palmitoyltransferase n=1 Tax=Notodromas monacha TaxID=399045 RepID=A0A7R9BPI3_9CRUS|nr:unnamed protein product [Notodromas monacha]CAG0917912.1 unnamed protein product [Notodromas monacha]
MEGTIVNLPEVIRLKKKYKAYLYVDEAHSIGALGPNGKGVADLFKTGTKDIDILMGTFTKSFAAFGGYISASKEIINHLRVSSHSPCYAQSMSPPVMQQIASTLSVIQGHDGTAEGKMKIQRLRQNAVYMRENLQKLGFHVYGHPECPIVPVKVSLICLPWVSRMMQAAGVSIVVVGSPAVAFFETRIRFCLSASHSRQQIDKVIDILDQIGHVMCAKKNKPDSFAEYRAKNMLRHRKGNYIEMADFIFG